MTETDFLDLLRIKAEALLVHNPPAGLLKRPVEELLRELQVKDIELQIQHDDLRRTQIALEESRALYLDLYEHAPIGYLMLSRDARITSINLTAVSLFGKDRHQLLQHRFENFIAPVDHEHWRQYFTHAMQFGDNQNCELTLLRSDGTHFFVCLASLLTNSDASEPALRITLIDNTALKQAKEAQKDANTELAFQSDEKGKRAAELIIAKKELAYQSSEKAKRASELVIANVELAFQSEEKGKRAAELVTANIELAYQSDEKSKRAAELVTANKELAYQSDEKANRAEELQEIKEEAESVRELAFYDALTSLPNRRLLNDRLTQAMLVSKRSGCYSALLFLDLDNFKPLNDQYGHEAGDLLLIEVANRLKKCVREIDTVARFGGDEFIVLLSELNTDKSASKVHARIVSEKIHTFLSEPYLLNLNYEGKEEATVEHHCTASIGVVLFISHEVSQKTILKRADSAMYKAKEAGRNQIQFYEY